MSEVSGIELEKDAAGNNSYVRIDLKKAEFNLQMQQNSD